MLQAIQVTYYGPTNTKGSRWRAKVKAKSKWFSRDYNLDVGDDAARCAESLANELEWLNHSRLEGGCLHDGSYCFVLVNK